MPERWDEEQFDFDIPEDEPIFPLNVVCDLIHMQYWTLHQIMEEGLIELRKKTKRKKLLSQKDIKRLKYIQYLMDDKGVNIQGIKVIFEMGEE